jgi:hypothetical protein
MHTYTIYIYLPRLAAIEQQLLKPINSSVQICCGLLRISSHRYLVARELQEMQGAPMITLGSLSY